MGEAMITTVGDYERINRTTVPAELTEHVEDSLQGAEDELERAVGRIFHSDDPAGRAGRDWIRAASWRAKRYMDLNDPDFQAAMANPLRSETIGRYSYTVKSPSDVITADPRIDQIVTFYRGNSVEIVYATPTGGDEYAR
jgi:hypothetical protein